MTLLGIDGSKDQTGRRWQDGIEAPRLLVLQVSTLACYGETHVELLLRTDRVHSAQYTYLNFSPPNPFCNFAVFTWLRPQLD